MLSPEQQQSPVPSLHDAVVEIKATLNNGLKPQFNAEGRSESVKYDVHLIHDALGLLLLQAPGRGP